MVWAVLLLAVVVIVNFLAVRWVLAINSVATWWKLVIPVATIFVLMAYSFHPANMTAHAASVPVSGIFTAVATAGIVFSFLGFQQAISLAGETRNPSRNIPLALIGSVLVGMLIYVGLQFAFITALDPRDISGGWEHLRFTGMFGPLAAIAIGVGAFWWAVVLYADAFVSPLGTAFIYVTASPRIIMAAGEMGSAPEYVVRLNRNGVPWVGLVVTYVVGVVFFFPFPSWQKLVSADSLIMVLAYAMAPVTLLHLRTTLPQAKRPFRLRGAGLLAPVTFVTSNWIIFWTGYEVVEWMLGAVLAYAIVYLAWYFLLGRRPGRELGWRQAWWIAPYLAGIWIVSYFGPASMGGQGKLGFFTGMWILAAFSLVILWLALRAGVRAAAAQECADRVKSLASSGVDPLFGTEEAQSA
jgi:amino acid transporter